ncbi:MAG: Crp/Fnr family transcriptional regulator [Verrucomicrobiota bacterium]|nr:Crp/Fnr family transcriptional regulator [Verrucomicrobiota bacterium]
MSREIQLPPQSLIFCDGDEADGVYVVQSGQIEIFRNSLKTKKPITIAMVGPGGMFGEVAPIDKMKRSASAQSTQASTIIFYSTEEFEAALARLPSWALFLVLSLSRRLRKTTDKLYEVMLSQQPKSDNSLSLEQLFELTQSSINKPEDDPVTELLNEFTRNQGNK